MNLYIAMLPTLIIVFGAGWLINIFKDFISAPTTADDVTQVEVINAHDFTGRK